jgi:hypothetical protein
MAARKKKTSAKSTKSTKQPAKTGSAKRVARPAKPASSRSAARPAGSDVVYSDVLHEMLARRLGRQD